MSKRKTIIRKNGVDYDWEKIEYEIQKIGFNHLNWKGMLYTDDILKWLVILQKEVKKHHEEKKS